MSDSKDVIATGHYTGGSSSDVIHVQNADEMRLAQMGE
jgi:hypothetical protein